MLKNERTARILGPAILFGVLFLPGYIYQSAAGTSTALTEPPLLAESIVLSLPQVLLILYVILTRGHGTKKAAGIVGFHFADLLKVLAGTVGLFIITIPSAFISRSSSDVFFTPVTTEITQPVTLLLLIPVCLVSGYREELFFRSYLLTELDLFGVKAGVIVGSLLFGLGHVYQGISGFAVTTLIGVFLAWLFLRTRNVHVVALAHGMYNYLVLLGGAWPP